MNDVSFDFPIQYDAGIRPRVSVARGTVVEVHQSEGGDTLWYHVGSLTGGLVRFGGSHQYDDGITPAVAVNAAGVVVEVHETQSIFSSGMYYHVGQVDAASQSIQFGGSHEYDSGNVPAVALNDQNVVVEVHESNGLSSKLWYHVGRADPGNKTVAWGGSHDYDTGSAPSVALSNQNVVVEVHRSEGLSNALWYHVGVVDPGTLTIEFGPSIQYDDGVDPSVALTDDGFVIEVHRSQTFNTLWKRIGRVDAANRRIDWIGGSVQYAGGSAPSVGTDGTTAVEAHQDGITLYNAASRVMDRTSWMHDRSALLGPQPLRGVVMPASHDAGMSLTQDCVLAGDCNTQTQTRSILGQLQAGSRYFDVRPVLFQDVLYAGHFDTDRGLGCNGQALSAVLDDVNAYLRGGGRDLVILKFSHYYDRGTGGGFSDAQMTRLLDQVTSALQPVLYSQPVPAGGLANVTVGEFLANGGTVLAVFDGLSDTLKARYTGVYSYADKGGTGDLVVYDNYANTNDLGGMVTDQLDKLDDPANHGDNLFLLSWTLTQSTTQAVGCVVGAEPSILDLAQEAGAALWPTLVGAYQQGKITSAQLPNLVYVDNLQGTMTDFAVWLNEEILG